MQHNPATMQETREHGWCMHLRQSQAFKFFLAEVYRLELVAQSKLCAENATNRDYQAGRLGALAEVQQIIEKRYKTLKPLVEVIPE